MLSDRDELLGRIYREGSRRRVRRRLAATTAALAVLAVAIGVPLALRDGPRTTVAAVGGSTTAPASTEGTATTTVESVDSSTVTTPTTGATTILETTFPPSTQSTTTSSTGTACRDSIDPTCGSFYWDPAPGTNQPMSYTVVVSPAAPHAGEVVTFHRIKEDPDADVHTGCGQSYYGDEVYEPYLPCWPECTQARYGPWTPPAPVPSRWEYDTTYTYAAAGTYTVQFSTRSGSQDGCNPYGSDGYVEVTVTVLP